MITRTVAGVRQSKNRRPNGGKATMTAIKVRGKPKDSVLFLLLLLGAINIVDNHRVHGWSLVPAQCRQNRYGQELIRLNSGRSKEIPSNNGGDTLFTVTRNQFLWKSVLVAGSSLCSNVPSRVNAMVTDPKSGIALPEEGEIERAVPTDWSTVENPFEEKTQFTRLDSTPDSVFYRDPRFVEHVDDQAVQLMSSYISKEAIPKDSSGSDVTVLDLCSSWTSHIDLSTLNQRPKRISGLGMNAKELSQNQVLVDWVVRDLNENPVLPYEDASFDVVLCQLSIDYLTRPLEVLKEVGRVLKSNGRIHILFSNRLFLSKVRKKKIER
jgi:hypothetical protein